MPIALTCSVVRLASWVVTTTRALRPFGESAAASMFRRVAGTSITRPGRDGTTNTRPLSSTRKAADAPAEALEVAVGRVAADRERVRASVRQGEQRRELSGLEPPGQLAT